MQRAARVLSQLRNQNLEADDLAVAAWRQAVGKRLDERTRARQMVRKTLIVEVEDAVWQKQLHSIRGHILDNLKRILGPGVVEEVEFRVGIPRRGPQLEQDAAQPAAPARDEADLIADPVLRHLYRESRRRAAARQLSLRAEA